MENRPDQRRTVKGKPPRKKRPSRIRWGRVCMGLIVLFLLIVGIWQAVVAFLDHQAAQAEAVVETTPVAVAPPPEMPKKYATVDLPDGSDGKPLYLLMVGLNTDHEQEITSLFLVSINRVDRKMDFIGIPTGTMIKSRDQKTIESIDSIYEKGSINLTKAVVEDIFHIEIPYFVVYNDYSFQKAMAEIGEFPFYIEHNYQQYNESGEDISLVQGYQKMTPEKAWSYMVYKSPAGAGEEQVQRQERLFKAIFAHMGEKSFLRRTYEVYRLWENFESNLSPMSARSLDNLVKNYTDINYYILPGILDTVTDEHKVYWEINPTEVPQILGGTLKTNGGTDDK